MTFVAPDQILGKSDPVEQSTSAAILRPSEEGQGALLVNIGERLLEQPMLVDKTGIRIRGFEQLPNDVRDQILLLMDKEGKNVHKERRKGIETVIFPLWKLDESGQKISYAALLGKITRFCAPKKTRDSQKRINYLIGRFTEPIDFQEVQHRANSLADAIDHYRDRTLQVLTSYETHQVATDEIERSIDLLRNLDENRVYFDVKIGKVAAFLPSNQPLYSLTCFGVVPGFMAHESHVKAPEIMKSFFPKLLEAIHLHEYAPNVSVVFEQREKFIKNLTAVVRNPSTGDEDPTTHAVIFTGTFENAQEVRKRFRREVLFIFNGAGHNPIIVSHDADIEKAVEAAIEVQLYNQGQDCAAPNAILVQRTVHQKFLAILREKLKGIKIGPYTDPSVRVGPISRPNDLSRIAEILVQNKQWLDFSTRGTMHADLHIVEPTIIDKPLKEGGNFEEQFAPIFFVQMYDNDSDLSQYFENNHYEPHAMYVTIHGTSNYVESLKKRRTVDGRFLHKEDSIIYNTHLHAEGQERGTEEYGGSGKWASSVSFCERTVGMATLPQREIGLLGKVSKQCSDVKMDDGKDSKMFRLQTKGVSEIAGSIAHRIPKDITLNQRNDKYIKGLHPITHERIARLRASIEQQSLSGEDIIRCAYEIIDEQTDVEPERDAKRKTFRNILFHLLVGKIMGKGKESYLVRIISFSNKEKLLELLHMHEIQVS